MTHKTSLDAAAREQLAAAHRADSGRSAATVVGGHERALRQTVVAMTAGSVLGEHANPGEATIYVISGRVSLHADDQVWQGRTGDLIEIPHTRHSLHADEDSAVLLTAVPIARLPEHDAATKGD